MADKKNNTLIIICGVALSAGVLYLIFKPSSTGATVGAKVTGGSLLTSPLGASSTPTSLSQVGIQSASTIANKLIGSLFGTSTPTTTPTTPTSSTSDIVTNDLPPVYDTNKTVGGTLTAPIGGALAGTSNYVGNVDYGNSLVNQGDGTWLDTTTGDIVDAQGNIVG